MLNKVILTGNVGRSPEIKVTQDGRTIAVFSLATSSSWKDATGEWQTHTEWHRIIVFRDSTVRWIKDVLKKGDTVYVEGKLTYHQGTDRYGHTRIISHVVIAGQQGCVRYLSSSRTALNESITDDSSNKDLLVEKQPESLSIEDTLNVIPFNLNPQSTQLQENNP